MSGPTSAVATEVVVARYGELWLKGRNRRSFERRLVRNLKSACEEVSPIRVERLHGQLVVVPERRARDVAARAREVFGLSSVSLARSVEPTTEAIADAAELVLAEALEALPPGRPIPFRVRTKRADKGFPLVSTELDRFVADRLLPGRTERLTVDLTRAELTVGIHVLPERAFVDAARLPGAGGLPVGTVGRAIALVSGGIDSPVAAWLAMKRGLEIVALTFHSAAFLGDGSKRKVERLARALARWQPRGRLLVAPFAEIQTAVRDGCPPAYRTVLYRRAMHRVACVLAGREHATALVTGDSLGQVASQTLENLTCTMAASSLPLLQPLLAFDKNETIALARRIGTFELSIENEPDCCTVFQPPRPMLRGRVSECEVAEAAIGLDALVERCADGVEALDL